MKRLTKKECQACMQKSNKYCFYRDKTFQQMVDESGHYTLFITKVEIIEDNRR